MGSTEPSKPQPSILLGKPPPQFCSATEVTGGLPWLNLSETYPLGRPPTRNMLRTDTTLYRQWAPPTADVGQPHNPWSQVLKPVGSATVDAGDIDGLQQYLQCIPSNHLVPAADAAEEEKDDEDPQWEFGQRESETKDGGVGHEWRRGVREYVDSGYTRRNPDGTYEADNDWRGKWEDAELAIGKVSDETEKAAVSVASGDFGDADSLVSGNGAVLGAEAQGTWEAALTTEGLKAEGGGTASAFLAQGEIATNKDHVASGSLEGAAGKVEATGTGELILTAEQATLGGKLGASANLVEGKAKGEISITPTRVSRAAVALYNWASGDDAEGLDDDWDFGIVLNGEISGAVGAQVEGTAEAGYKDGKARAEAGLKLGLGVGAGVKAGGGLTGLDKAWARIKDGGAWVGKQAGSAWSGIKGGWNSIWN